MTEAGKGLAVNGYGCSVACGMLCLKQRWWQQVAHHHLVQSSMTCGEVMSIPASSMLLQAP
jgi:hypothetical protein